MHLPHGLRCCMAWKSALLLFWLLVVKFLLFKLTNDVDGGVAGGVKMEGGIVAIFVTIFNLLTGIAFFWPLAFF